MSGMVENMGVQLEYRRHLSYEKLFPLPVSGRPFECSVMSSDFRYQPTSDNVGSARDVSGIFANVGVAVGIVAASFIASIGISTSVSVAAILIRSTTDVTTMSGDNAGH